jgi:outer membrane protein assembly factor BamB
VVWSTGDEWSVVSDPLGDPPGVAALTISIEQLAGARKKARAPWTIKKTRRHSQGPAWEMQWSVFDSSSGKLLEQKPLIRMQVRDRATPVCRAAADDDSIAGCVPGGLVCTDREGNLRWVRRYPLPENTGPRQVEEGPVAHSGRIFVLRPDGTAVQCIEARLGRLQWECPVPERTRLIGATGERLLVANVEGLRAIDMATGRTIWRFPIAAPQAILCGGPGRLAYAGLIGDQDSGRPRPTLVWLDPANGRTVSSQRLDTAFPEQKHARPVAVGFLAGGEDRLFVGFFPPGNGRRLLAMGELLPVGE